MTKSTKPQATRRYVVVDANGHERLVKAPGPSGAVIHVYNPAVRLATADDVERLITEGVKTETAGDPITGSLPGV